MLSLNKILQILDGYTGCIIRRKSTKQEAERRVNICAQCPFATDDGLCSQCGCIIKCKAHARHAECPDKRW